MKLLRLTLFAALAAALGSGCDKSPTPAAPRTVPYSLSSQTVAHLHWLGKNQLAGATNAAGLMRIWNEPESAAVETQALDKLSTAPWRLLPHVATTNPAAAPLLRPLLDDCVQRESYLEIRAATNQPGEIAFAIRLPAARAALWQTNLAAVVESLTGLQTENSGPGTRDSGLPTGWSLKKHEAPNLLELIRVGDWVVVGLGQDKNALFGDFTARVLRDHSPVATASPGMWLDAGIDLRSVVDAFKLDWKLPADLSKIAVQASGDGQNVQTRGTLNFTQPFALAIEPWNVPTNLIRGGLGSFTALRGFASWLGSQKTWNDLQLGPAPHQLFVWAGYGIPMQTLFAFPVSDATSRLPQITNSFLQKVDPWLETNKAGHFEPAAEFQGLTWTGVPALVPYLRASGDFIYGGFFTPPTGKYGLPAEMLRQLDRTNTVYYDWELTSPRLESWLLLGQILRVALHKSQLPPSPGLDWLLGNQKTLGNCLTVGTRSGPDQLAFTRTSAGVGFTAFELHLLADWLASQDFPAGLNTFRGRVPVLQPGLIPRVVPAHAPAVPPASPSPP